MCSTMLRDFYMQVLCVLLLQNAGPKSKDVSARSMAIDLLGTIAARLKQEAVLCGRERFWMLQELVREDSSDQSYPKDLCCVCLDGRVEKRMFMCQGCQRLFHADCLGVREHEVPNRGWNCQLCLCRNQLLVLQSYCKSHCKGDINKSHSRSESNPETSDTITKLEIVQQMLLNYLQDAVSADEMNLFVRWFVLKKTSFLTCFILLLLLMEDHSSAGVMCAYGTRMIRKLNKSPCTTLLD